MPVFGFLKSLRSSKPAILLLSILLHSLLLFWRPSVTQPAPASILVPVSITLSSPVKSEPSLLPAPAPAPVARTQKYAPPSLSASMQSRPISTQEPKRVAEMVIDSDDGLVSREQGFAQKALKDVVSADRLDRQRQIKSGALLASGVEYKSAFGQEFAKSTLRDCRDVLAEEDSPESRGIAKISDGLPMIIVDMKLLQRMKNCRW